MNERGSGDRISIGNNSEWKEEKEGGFPRQGINTTILSSLRIETFSFRNSSPDRTVLGVRTMRRQKKKVETETTRKRIEKSVASFPRKNPPSQCSHPVYLLSVYVRRQRTNEVARTPYPRLDGVSQKTDRKMGRK